MPLGIKKNRVSNALLTNALQLLRAGDVVAIPTETVYGLAADARNANAVAKVFSLKGRPSNHPVIVHIADSAQINAWACNIPPLAYRLAEAFWPGPLTLVLTCRSGVLPSITGGQTTVALRCPRHPLTLQLLREFGDGVCAPSANRFGELSPTRAAHVRASFGDRIPLILEADDACDVGIESTIVDVSQATPCLLRPGSISQTELSAVVNCVLRTAHAHSPRVPGALASHYAPHTPVQLVTLKELHDLVAQPLSAPLIILGLSNAIRHPDAHWIAMPTQASAYAQQLYYQLHIADEMQVQRILVEKPPTEPQWEGIHDRLAKMQTHDLGVKTHARW